MYFRVAGSADTEVTVFFDECYQFGSVGKVSKYFTLEVIWQVASECKDILDACGFHFIQCSFDVFFACTYAGQM